MLGHVLRIGPEDAEQRRSLEDHVVFLDRW